MLKHLLILFYLLSASTSFAACLGTDLRSALTDEQKSEVQNRLAVTPYPSGNHWRAQKQGSTIHLIGTIHLDDPRLLDISNRLSGVIETSGIVLVEATEREEAQLKDAMSTRPDLLFLKDTSLAELLPEANWQALSTEMSKRSIPPMIASRFRPWYVAILLAMPPCLMAEMANGAKGLDHKLMEIAKAAAVPVQALEPYDTLFTLFEDDSIQEQLDVLRVGLATADSSEDMLATLINAYYAEDHALAWEISRALVLGTPGYDPAELERMFAMSETDLLTTRNQAWIPIILKAAQEHKQITVAAGAGHLAGPLGVLALLEAEGYTLERMPF